MHKTQKLQTYSFILFYIYLRTFSKTIKFPFFWSVLIAFFRGICNKSFLSVLFFFKLFLTRQFYEFSFLRCSFPSWHAHFFSCPVFCILVSVISQYKLYCTVRYTAAILYEDMIFISLVAFYFTPYYITTKHNNNNDKRHKTVWLDSTIDHTFHQNISDGIRSSSSSNDFKVPHQSNSPPFCFAAPLLLLLFILYYTAAVTVNNDWSKWIKLIPWYLYEQPRVQIAPLVEHTRVTVQ